MPKIIDSSAISVRDPLIEDFWPIFAEKFSTQKFCEWRVGIKRVNWLVRCDVAVFNKLLQKNNKCNLISWKLEIFEIVE